MLEVVPDQKKIYEIILIKLSIKFLMLLKFTRYFNRLLQNLHSFMVFYFGTIFISILFRIVKDTLIL